MADAKLRLAFVGADHLHFRGLLRAALECPAAEVVGMAIGDDELRAYWAGEQPGVPAFADAAALYASVSPTAIITCADNAAAADVVAEAAERGVQVMKEKPMAASLCLLHGLPFEGIVSAEVSRDAQEILEAGLESMALGQEVGLPLKAFLA